MTVYLVRHAHAGSRSDWGQPDDIRPLSAKGLKQAEAVKDRLADRPIKRILSSPSMRCRLTVEPLALQLGLEVELADELLEGAPADRAVAFLASAASEDDEVAACTHGDLIPDVLRHLAARGTAVKGPRQWPKGSTWALDWDDGRFVRGRYLGGP